MTSEAPKDPMLPWPSASKYRRSIRREFAIYVGGLVVILMLVTGIIITNKLVTTVTQNVVETLLVQARSSAGAAAKQVIAADGPDVLMLTDICSKLKAESPPCGWAAIAGGDGRFLAHTDMRQVISGTSFHLIPSSGYDGTLRKGEILQVNADSIIVAVPIIEQGLILGTLVTSSSKRQIAAVRRSALVTMSVFTLVMAAIGVALTAVVLRRRLRPLSLITDSLRNVETGSLTLDPPVRDKNEFGFLADTLRVMGTRLEHAKQLAVEADRMSRELDIAREIQSNILPKSYPEGDGYQFAGTYRSARTVGGDYFDFIELGADKLAVIIGDVSGKSLPGMLVMLLTRDLVLKHARRSVGPAELLSAVNKDLLPEVRKGTFVTMFCGILDTTTGLLRFASAGHNPLIHVVSATQEQRLIKTKGYPLGLMSADQFDRRIESGQIQLADDDWCVLYTDGINEAMNASNAEYGMDRFLSIANRSAALPAADFTRAIMDDIESFVGASPQADDITLVSLKWARRLTNQPTDTPKERQYVAAR